MNRMLYPLKFEPILKSVIWGGEEICKFKNILPFKSGIGECWELSGLKKEISIVKNGFFKGKSLSELIVAYGEKLIGKSIFKHFENTFPLLIKLIDAREPLSIQVHPNDFLAKKKHRSFGKTEMWYIIKAAEDAFLYAGFQKKINPDQYIQSLKNNTLTDYLYKYKVESDDVFFLPAGCVHAIGSGCFIAEIQQTSDITYRIYDYNRKDSSGHLRPLHIELAKEAIDYQIHHSFQLNSLKTTQSVLPLVDCSYFSVNRIKAEKDDQMNRQYEDRFVIYICLQGKIVLTDKFNHTTELQSGETVLIPANNSLNINLFFKDNSKLLETYIKR